MSVLSARQQAAAKKVAAQHLGMTANVSRAVKTDTPTGHSTALVVIFQGIPSDIAPVSDTNPTARESGDVSKMELRGYCWFPLQWPDARVEVPDGEEPVMVDVEIQLGDVIEIGGHTWQATTDEDPPQDYPTRKRVRVYRPHVEVVA